MKYIGNTALREYVKEELRVSIFQMAHKLAIQTGCEVLVKLEDCADHSGCQYYATRTLNLQYMDKGLSRQPWEEMVSGVTGLPVSNHSGQHDQNEARNGCDAQTGDYDMRNNRGNDDTMNHSGGSHFSNNLSSSSLGNDDSTMLDQMNEDGGQTIVHLVKAEPNSSLSSIADEESWTKTTVTLPFPVAIESALSGQQGGADADADQVMDPDQIQQQIYIYANTNTEDKEDILDQSGGQEDLTDDQTTAGRRRTPALLNYKCTLCQKKTSSVQLLIRHAKACHPGNERMRYHCVPCDREYKHGRHLEQHTELHSKASYRCSTCCKGFYRSSTLREHELRDHQGRYRYYCPKCHKGFMRPSTMQTHLSRSHPTWFNKNKTTQLFVANTTKSSDNLPRIVIPVNKDGDELNSPSTIALTEGMPSTSGNQGPTTQSTQESSGGAGESAAGGTQRTTVNEELRNQTQKKMMKVVYQCKECGRMYENANSLVRHIHDRHDSRTKMRCNQCSYRTSRTSDLARHKRAKHLMTFASTMQPKPEQDSDRHDKESESDDPSKESDL